MKEIAKILLYKHSHGSNAAAALTLPLVPLFCPTSTNRAALTPPANASGVSPLTTAASLQQPTSFCVQH